MGIFINGALLPNEVTNEQWSSAYHEALKLVEAYDFLDIITEQERFSQYRVTWVYGIKAREREVMDGSYGVPIFGAYNGCIPAEMNFLSRDLAPYTKPAGYLGDKDALQKNQSGKLCHDALLGTLNDHEGLEEYQDYTRCIFGNKTQGYDHHNYLLAIALLFEDRLGKAFAVYGDITLGQIKYAIKWANQYLERPISMPCRTDKSRLLERLSSFVPRKTLINAFMQLAICHKDEQLNAFLLEHFSREELLEFWKGEISYRIPGTLGASDFFKNYFGISGDMKLLAQICASKFTFDEFAKELAKTRVFEKEKYASDPSAATPSDSERESPETIEVVTSKVFAVMSGLVNSAVERYIPLEQGLQELQETIHFFKDSDVNVELVLKNWIAEKAPIAEDAAKSIMAFEEYGNKLMDEVETVDIYEAENLVFYKTGDTIHNSLKKILKDIRDFVDNNREDMIASFNATYVKGGVEGRGIRMALLCKSCSHLLPKNIWDLYEVKIRDDAYFFTLYTLLSLKSNTLPLSHYVRGLLYSPALFEKVILSDEINL